MDVVKVRIRGAPELPKSVHRYPGRPGSGLLELTPQASSVVKIKNEGKPIVTAGKGLWH